MLFPNFQQVDVAKADREAQGYSQNAVLNHMNAFKLGQDIQNTQRADAARPEIKNAFVAYLNGDMAGYNAAAGRAVEADPVAGMNLIQSREQFELNRAQRAAATDEVKAKRLKMGYEHLGRLGATTMSPEHYASYRQQMIKDLPEVAGYLPETYDQNYFKSFQDKKVTITDGGLVTDQDGNVIGDHRTPKGPQSTPGKILADVKSGLLTPEEGQKALAGNGKGVTVNVGGSENPSAVGDKKFYETIGAKQAEKFNNLIEASNQANYMLGDIAQLDVLSENAGTGKLASLKSQAGAWADALNIPLPDGFENFADGQAMEAIVSRLIPKLRPPGSGTMSDRDVELFKKSLPNLSTSPAGNRIIIQSLRRIAERSVQEGEIASRVASGEITRAAGEKEISSLGPIFTKDEVTSWFAAAKNGPLGSQPATAPQNAKSAATPARKKLANGKTYYQDASGDWFEE